ncbi:hypothetical protein ACFL5Q_06825 [Planctomycetota bacterium]
MAPYEFRDATEIIERLSTERDKIATHFDRREDSLEVIVKEAVGGSTFRSFRLAGRSKANWLTIAPIPSWIADGC